MKRLDEIIERVHQNFEVRTAARDQALRRARLLTRHCAHAIRAVHRKEAAVVQAQLEQAAGLAQALREDLVDYPDLYFAGYTQDALKEFAEANIVYALIENGDIPTPEDLQLEYNTYMKGLAEAVGELRRHCLDIIRHGDVVETERLFGHMEDIYTVLITIDYPDAVTSGLRRLTDVARSITERTRGDLTISLRQQQLEFQLRRLAGRLED